MKQCVTYFVMFFGMFILSFDGSFKLLQLKEGHIVIETPISHLINNNTGKPDVPTYS